MNPANTLKRYLPEDLENAFLGFTPDWGRDLLSSLASADTSYPPSDIICKDKNNYEIRLACAGFSKDEINIFVEKSVLKIEGKKHETEEDQRELNKNWRWIQKGIATRKFIKSFMMADHLKIDSATYEDGILSVSLIREIPEEEKPKKIPIL